MISFSFFSISIPANTKSIRLKALSGGDVVNRGRQTRESGLSEDLGPGWRLLVVPFQAVPIGVAPLAGAPAVMVRACA